MRIQSAQSPTFKNLHPADVKYKEAIIKGLKSKFNISPKVETLKSLAGPMELKALLKKFIDKHYELGVRVPNSQRLTDFSGIQNGTFRVNLHTHTNKSDGALKPIEFLAQSTIYANTVAGLMQNDDELPPYTTATTDHNNFEASQEIIAAIASNPDKFKNLKFVAGCEFIFIDRKSPFKYPAFEAVGLGFNPFDKELSASVQKFNPIENIELVKKDGAVVSYAHPARLLQGNGIEPDFIEYLKQHGVNGIEANYQYINIIDYKELRETIAAIKKIADEQNFYKTGGNDSHTSNIFSITKPEIIDEITKKAKLF